MRNSIFLLLFLVISVPCIGQFDQDSTVQLISGERVLFPYQNKLKPDLRLDARRTLFQQNWIAIGGLRLGVQYRRIHKLGLGFYFLNTRIFVSEFEYDIDTDVVEYDFKYNAIYYDRTLFFNKRWDVGASLNLGGGDITARYQPEGTNYYVKVDEIPFSVTELSLFGTYNILHWLGIGSSFGYRRIWARTPSVDKSFSSPIFAVSLQLRVTKLVRAFFDESVKDEY